MTICPIADDAGAHGRGARADEVRKKPLQNRQVGRAARNDVHRPRGRNTPLERQFRVRAGQDEAGDADVVVGEGEPDLTVILELIVQQHQLRIVDRG